MFDFHSPEIWFILGLAFIILEVALGLTIVVFFLALSAFSMGFLLYLEVFAFKDVVVQIVVFLSVTICWAILLWHPLKKLKNAKSKKLDFQNYIGQSVKIIDKDLVKGEVGSAKWSGAIIKVSIDEKSNKNSIVKNKTATIIDVINNVFIVK